MATTSHLVRRGLAVGLIGYASVAVFYAVFDFLAARGALYTVDLLGKAMFRGLRDAAVLGLPMELDWTAIFWYNLVHLAVAITVGLIIIGLIEDALRNPSRSGMVFFTVILGFMVTIAVMTVLTDSIRPLLPWWSIVVANALAVVVAGSYLLRVYPGLWNRLSPFGGSNREGHRSTA